MVDHRPVILPTSKCFVALATVALLLSGSTVGATTYTTRVIHLEAPSTEAPTVTSSSTSSFTTVTIEGTQPSPPASPCCFDCVTVYAFNQSTYSCDTTYDLCEDCNWECPCASGGLRGGDWIIQTPVSTPPTVYNNTADGVNTVAVIAPSGYCFSCEVDPQSGNLCDGLDSPCVACTRVSCP